MYILRWKLGKDRINHWKSSRQNTCSDFDYAASEKDVYVVLRSDMLYNVDDHAVKWRLLPRGLKGVQKHGSEVCEVYVKNNDQNGNGKCAGQHDWMHHTLSPI